MYAFAFVLSTVPSFPVVPNEAELLFREMDAKITAAKSLRIEFTIDESTAGKEQRLTQGSLVIADRNRLSCELSGMVAVKAVSDGKQMVIVVGDPPEKRSHATPDWLNEFLQRSLGRGGTFVSFSRTIDRVEKSDSGRPEAKDGPQVANARMLPPEDLNGTKALVIEYDLSWPKGDGEADTAKTRVWIDPETRLPLRRTMTFPIGSEQKSFTAIHTKFELNPKIDDKLFELPK